MKKVMTIVFLMTLQLGCSHFDTAFVNGHLNVVIKSHKESYENGAWRFVTKNYGVENQQIVRPLAHSAKLKEIQDRYETNEYNRRVRLNLPLANPPIKKVLGFYDPRNNEVWYPHGEYGTLAHEYCHSLNRQVGKGNIPEEMDEYICAQVKQDFEDRPEIRRLRRDNRLLQDELNRRKFR